VRLHRFYNRFRLFFFCSLSVFFAPAVAFFADAGLSAPAALGAADADTLAVVDVVVEAADRSFVAVFKLATSFLAWMLVHRRACLAYSS
jgi:hypothetical protein